jgi:hypothetical protein
MRTQSPTTKRSRTEDPHCGIVRTSDMSKMAVVRDVKRPTRTRK